MELTDFSDDLILGVLVRLHDVSLFFKNVFIKSKQKNNDMRNEFITYINTIGHVLLI